MKYHTASFVSSLVLGLVASSQILSQDLFADASIVNPRMSGERSVSSSSLDAASHLYIDDKLENLYKSALSTLKAANGETRTEFQLLEFLDTLSYDEIRRIPHFTLGSPVGFDSDYEADMEKSDILENSMFVLPRKIVGRPFMKMTESFHSVASGYVADEENSKIASKKRYKARGKRSKKLTEESGKETVIYHNSPSDEDHSEVAFENVFNGHPITYFSTVNEAYTILSKHVEGDDPIVYSIIEDKNNIHSGRTIELIQIGYDKEKNAYYVAEELSILPAQLYQLLGKYEDTLVDLRRRKTSIDLEKRNHTIYSLEIHELREKYGDSYMKNPDVKYYTKRRQTVSDRIDDQMDKYTKIQTSVVGALRSCKKLREKSPNLVKNLSFLKDNCNINNIEVLDEYMKTPDNELVINVALEGLVSPPGAPISKTEMNEVIKDLKTRLRFASSSVEDKNWDADKTTLTVIEENEGQDPDLSNENLDSYVNIQMNSDSDIFSGDRNQQTYSSDPSSIPSKTDSDSGKGYQFLDAVARIFRGFAVSSDSDPTA